MTRRNIFTCFLFRLRRRPTQKWPLSILDYPGVTSIRVATDIAHPNPTNQLKSTTILTHIEINVSEPFAWRDIASIPPVPPGYCRVSLDQVQLPEQLIINIEDRLSDILQKVGLPFPIR